MRRELTGWEPRDCEGCFQPFSPDRRGQRLCSRCHEQEDDAYDRHREPRDVWGFGGL